MMNDVTYSFRNITTKHMALENSTLLVFSVSEGACKSKAGFLRGSRNTVSKVQNGGYFILRNKSPSSIM
jgi:hypothetical protein